MFGKNKFLILIAFFLFWGEAVFAQTKKPKILLSFPESFKANEEIEVLVSVSNLKNVSYDIKIAIEKEKEILSDVYNEKEKRWQSSLYYLKNLISGPSFEGKFKLRLKKNFSHFEGEAEILVRIRESSKSNFYESREKIKILKPEIKKEKEIEKENFLLLTTLSHEENRFISSLLAAFFVSAVSVFFVSFLKTKLERKK